jgi:hypothetical protein
MRRGELIGLLNCRSIDDTMGCDDFVFVREWWVKVGMVQVWFYRGSIGFYQGSINGFCRKFCVDDLYLLSCKSLKFKYIQKLEM